MLTMQNASSAQPIFPFQWDEITMNLYNEKQRGVSMKRNNVQNMKLPKISHKETKDKDGHMQSRKEKACHV